jgi:hypothetical protein
MKVNRRELLKNAAFVSGAALVGAFCPARRRTRRERRGLERQWRYLVYPDTYLTLAAGQGDRGNAPAGYEVGRGKVHNPSLAVFPSRPETFPLFHGHA